MGLDIQAASKVKRVASLDDEAAENRGDVVRLWPFPDEKELASRAEGLEEGAYEAADVFGFRAGSYGGYNSFREALSRMVMGVPPEVVWAHKDDFREEPFFELIWFADNEGCIGPLTSAKLHRDFVAWDERARENLDEYDYETYLRFTEAFGLAADGGAVQFC